MCTTHDNSYYLSYHLTELLTDLCRCYMVVSGVNGSTRHSTDCIMKASNAALHYYYTGTQG